MKRKAIICDIDGVLLHTEHIFQDVERLGLLGADMWEYFNRHANDWKVEADGRVVDVLRAFAKAGYKIIFVTARSIEIWKHTRAKIDLIISQYSDFIFSYDLAMRGIKDCRSSAEVKQTILNDIKSDYNIICAIDDDCSNCEMFAKNNILTMQVIKERKIA